MSAEKSLLSVQTYSLVDQIVAVLTEEIITGKYVPGARLKEQEIALRFGVSRAPLREAFRVLDREGLIQLISWKGAHVVELSSEQIREIFEARAELFAVCCRRFAADANFEDLAAVQKEIADLIRAAEAGCDEKDYKVRANAISVLISTTQRNRYLRSIMHDLRQKMFWYYCYLGTSTLERRRESNQLWAVLAQCLQARDGERAAAVAYQVTMRSGEFALKVLSETKCKGNLRSPD